VARITKEKALDAEYVFETREVEVPAFGGSVLIRRLSMDQESRAAAGVFDDAGRPTNIPELQARRIAAAIIEPDFTVTDIRHLLKRHPAESLKPLIDAIDELNDSAAAAAAVKAAEAEFRDADD